MMNNTREKQSNFLDSFMMKCKTDALTNISKHMTQLILFMQGKNNMKDFNAIQTILCELAKWLIN